MGVTTDEQALQPWYGTIWWYMSGCPVQVGVGRKPSQLCSLLRSHGSPEYLFTNLFANCSWISPLLFPTTSAGFEVLLSRIKFGLESSGCLQCNQAAIAFWLPSHVVFDDLNLSSRMTPTCRWHDLSQPLRWRSTNWLRAMHWGSLHIFQISLGCPLATLHTSYKNCSGHLMQIVLPDS